MAEISGKNAEDSQFQNLKNSECSVTLKLGFSKIGLLHCVIDEGPVTSDRKTWHQENSSECVSSVKFTAKREEVKREPDVAGHGDEYQIAITGEENGASLLTTPRDSSSLLTTTSFHLSRENPFFSVQDEEDDYSVEPHDEIGHSKTEILHAKVPSEICSLPCEVRTVPRFLTEKPANFRGAARKNESPFDDASCRETFLKRKSFLQSICRNSPTEDDSKFQSARDESAPGTKFPNVFTLPKAVKEYILGNFIQNKEVSPPVSTNPVKAHRSAQAKGPMNRKDQAKPVPWSLKKLSSQMAPLALPDITTRFKAKKAPNMSTPCISVSKRRLDRVREQAARGTASMNKREKQIGFGSTTARFIDVSNREGKARTEDQKERENKMASFGSIVPIVTDVKNRGGKARTEEQKEVESKNTQTSRKQKDLDDCDLLWNSFFEEVKQSLEPMNEEQISLLHAMCATTNHTFGRDLSEMRIYMQ